MKSNRYVILSIIFVILLYGIGYGAILPMWNDEKAYRPIPVVFIHGMNSSPEAWGFMMDLETEKVIFYFGTAGYLRPYFDEYYTFEEDRAKFPYLEPFNYGYNTFDAVEWNSYEGKNNTGLQHPDERISESVRSDRLVLRDFIGQPYISPSSPGSGILDKYQTSKGNLVGHSLGGVVSRYYINKTQGANVRQLTTLGTPHKGAIVATVAEHTFSDSVTDPFGWKIIWRIVLYRLFDNLDVNRKPEMIYELNPTSEFIANLNSSIPSLMRYYCIGGAIRALPLVPILFDTDAFIELHSALASRGNIPSEIPADYQPESILPNYKGKILVPNIVNLYEYKHTVLPEKWKEILKAVDDTKPVIELTEVKDIQNRVLWRTGQYPDYFEVPQDGRIKVHGLCRKEYLPADTYINIGYRKAGRTEVQWVKDGGGLTLLQDEAQKSLLQPSDSWRVTDPESPVAEFEVEVNFPLQEITHSIVVEATNPAGLKSDIVEVSEKTFYLYGVVKDGSGVSKLWCIDGPTSFVDSIAAIVQEIKLVNEEGNPITSRALGVTRDGGSIWISFDDRRLRKYNPYGEPEKVDGTNWYWTALDMPDGLEWDGNNLWYSSSQTNKINRLNQLGEVVEGIGLGVPNFSPRGLVFDGKYKWASSFNREEIIVPTGDKRLEFVLTTPVRILGMAYNSPYVYASGEDGMMYRLRRSEGLVTVGQTWGKDTVGYSYTSLHEAYNSARTSGLAVFLWPDIGQVGHLYSRYGGDPYTYRANLRRGIFGFNTSVFQVVSSSLGLYLSNKIIDKWAGGSEFAVKIYGGSYTGNGFFSPSEYIGEQYTGEMEVGYWHKTIKIEPRYINKGGITYFRLVDKREEEGIELFDPNPPKTPDLGWEGAFFGSGALMVLTEAEKITVMPEVWEGVGTGDKIKMRIKPGYPTSLNPGDIIQFEAHGKEPLKWITSDENMGKVDSNGLFTAVGKGTCTVTVQDALENMAVSEAISVQ